MTRPRRRLRDTGSFVRYGVAFAAMSAALVYLAARHGGWAWLLAWPAVSFAIVAAGYLRLGPRVMGKTQLGDFSGWSRVLLLPFRAFVLLGWYAGRLIQPGPAHAEILPGVWLGRRVSAGELPPGTSIVIDLTSEIAVPRRVRDQARRYICLPTLDRGVPDVAAARAALDEAAKVTRGGGVYIHCAQGFGRSAALVAAMLIRSGACRNVDDAEARLKSLRPGVRLTRQQRAFVTELTETRDAPPPVPAAPAGVAESL
jgi:protein-tyrosine phosphatase